LHEKSNVHEMRWAYSVLITEKILLDAFKPPSDTVLHMDEAVRKILAAGYIDYHAGAIYEEWDVSANHQPTFNRISASVQLTLCEVITCIVREPWYEKLKKKSAFQDAKSREKAWLEANA